ncbi:MAG: MBL fold metallo-hydrolase, partial [Saprospiraceae bacterium]|nr:MBL fold metallo-hydrolase [Saprospiraceae bacterium]
LLQKSANCLWVVFKEYVLAVDPNYPWGAEEILEEIKKTTDKPVRFIFNTHYHHDHSFGNSVFVDQGAIVVASATTSDEMKTVGQIEWNRGTAYSGRDMKRYRREFPTITFDQQLVFDDGTHKVILIKIGPGHTAGDAVAYLPNEKILSTGDLCVNGNPWGNNVADVNANYEHWLAALDTLYTWDIRQVIPGHGDIGPKTILKQQRDYLADMYTQVSNGIKTGKTREELINQIDLSKHPVRGSNTISNTRSIKAMYDRLKGGN